MATTDDEDDHTDEQKSPKGSTAAHAANVDEAVDREPHDPHSELEEDTIEAKPQDPNDQEASNQDTDSNFSIDSVPQDDAEDGLEPLVDYMVRATNEVDDLCAASGITSWILRQSRTYWRQGRVIAKHHDGRRTKLISK